MRESNTARARRLNAQKAMRSLLSDALAVMQGMNVPCERPHIGATPFPARSTRRSIKWAIGRPGRPAPPVTSQNLGHANKITAGSVLVVDDDPDIRAALELLLRTAGFEVAVARSGREALQLLDGEGPGLIVLDLMMPEMDGWAFLAAAGTKVPVIVVSGVGNLAHRPLDGNIVGRMSKPFDV